MNRPLHRRKRVWFVLLLFAAAVAAAAFRHELAGLAHHLRWPEIRAAILSAGRWAPLLCILLYALFTVCWMPTTLVGVLVALLFGPWLGLPICLAGLALGMGASFLVSRHLLHDWIERRIGDSRLYRRIEDHLLREGWKLVFFSRILPVNPFCFLNYAYGLTRIPFWTFLAASVAGVVPNTLALLWTVHAAGQLAGGRFDSRILAALFAGAFLFAALAWLPRLVRRKMPSALPSPGDEFIPDP